MSVKKSLPGESGTLAGGRLEKKRSGWGVRDVPQRSSLSVAVVVFIGTVVLVIGGPQGEVVTQKLHYES